MFDFGKFLRANFGNPRGLLSLLAAYGYDNLLFPTVEKWFQRKSVPAEWFPVLLLCLELETGVPVKLSAYMGGTK